MIKNLHGASEIQGAADLIAFAKSCQRTALIRRATSACSSVSLSNVLKKAGIGNKPHLAISCHDDCEENREKFKYGVSIPMAKARDPDTILAWDMNGETLTAERGFPLRLVVPGFAGASVIKEKADWSKAPVINEMPLNRRLVSSRKRHRPSGEAHCPRVCHLHAELSSACGGVRRWRQILGPWRVAEGRGLKMVLGALAGGTGSQAGRPADRRARL